jgi:hypothetical protein
MIAIITGFITGIPLSVNRIIRVRFLENIRVILLVFLLKASEILNDPNAFAFLGLVMYPPRVQFDSLCG